ncbi:lycopene beta-cyclase [Blastomonas natatoria]|uniref:Lycopene beta-cyclase n=1 Tax=Blastomonas natatoria TaxID=34015 RepID=A0A2V3UWU6_9SPHN|nr:lycopene beta-cyclase CrtY [Blastomonas natatoria]PXW73832.1 lycopene beta-cyclase [Blastomonas natatoria]
MKSPRNISSKTLKCDVAILGGGLAGGLIALALRRKRPELEVLLIEESASLGGNHIWSFFGPDVAGEHRWLVAPLVCHGWRGYDVKFPGHERGLEESYYSILSDRFDAYLREAIPAHNIVTGVRALAASQTNVVLENGARIEAGGVIDARGGGNVRHLRCGWQKFMGQMLHLSEPHGLTRPIVMDATVEQIDGYRFVYCLPVSPMEIFVEDTYYSDTSDLDTQALSARISAYADSKGWQVERVSRTETGALPVVYGGDFGGYWQSTGGDVAKAGTRAALFHGLTGYSLPDAVRLAAHIAEMPDLSGAALAEMSRKTSLDHWQADGFYRMLTKMLFKAAGPDERYRVLERFYTLPDGLIARFYAGKSTLLDKMRVLAGRPPMPIWRAIRGLFS